MLATLPTECD